MKPGSVFIVADVPESRIGAVDMGEPAYLEFNSYPGKTFNGKVISIGEVVDSQTRTIKVGMELSNKDGRLKPGMYARVRIEDRKIHAVIVPPEAVASVDAKNFVFIKTGARSFECREIITGESADDDIIVLEGLKGGEEIVVSNVILLKGMFFGY